MKPVCLVLLSLSLAGTAALPVAADTKLPKIGPEVELTVPLSSEARDKFGSVITGIGLGFGKVVPKQGGHYSPDLLVVRQEKGGNKLTFFGAGIQYRRTFTNEIQPDSRFVPYYGAGAGLAYGKVQLSGASDDSKVVPTGSVFVGTSIGKSGLIEARVRALPDVGGINFSGFSLTLGARF